MKAIPHVLVALVIAVGFLLAGCGKKEEGGAAQPAAGAGTAQEQSAEGPQITQTLCPVMGKPIDKSIYVDHEGRRIYLCCPMCVDTFKADPATYLAKLDAGP